MTARTESSSAASGPRAAPAVRAGLYECAISHVRSAPLRNRFTYRSYLWLVDVDDLPRLPRPLRPLAGFRAGDHLGPPPAPGQPPSGIRQNLDRFLADQGVDLDGGRVWLLTSARVFGFVFNPISVYWCHDAAGRPACVVAEVHNTYGGRHCYLVRTDERGRAEAGKALYVSPFEPVRGSYRMSLPEPAERLDLTITLHRPGGPPFVAGVRGTRRPATAGTLLRLALRYPVAPLVVAARIRWQGIRLVLRGLRVVPRPHDEKQRFVQ